MTTIGYDIEPYGEKLAESSIEHVSLGVLESSNKGIVSQFFYIIKLAHIFFKIKPDLVHFFTMQPVLLGPIASRIARISCITTVTGLGHLFLSITEAPNKIAKLLMLHSSATATVSVFQNSQDAAALRQHKCLAARSKEIVIRGSGVDTNHFITNRCPEIRGKIKFILVGRLIKEKGIFEYCDAVRLLSEKYKAQAEFLLAGDTDEYNPTAISVSEVSVLSSASGIRYLGHVTEIKPLLDSCDILVLPSYREGLSKALLEGASMSMALIATDVPGCNDIVKDGTTGLLVKLKSAHDLIRAFEFYVDNSEKIREHGKAGRNLVLENFSDKQILSEVLNLYGEC